MIIKALSENTAKSEEFCCEHGLSLYIETSNFKLLFDVGASGIFYKNAQKLDVDISDVDYLVISHGHYDHGGGLETFIDKNKKAEIFLHRLAFEKHFARREDNSVDFIGLKDDLSGNRRIVNTSDRFFIRKGLQLFSNIDAEYPKSNKDMLTEKDGKLTDDGFAHEQNLIVEDDGISLLLTGCAHNGIINIIEHFKTLKGRLPDYVIGGFHLTRRNESEKPEKIKEIADYLLLSGARFYTCHCTGLAAYEILKEEMGERISYLSAGSEISIP